MKVNLFIAGAARCGTTYLSSCLQASSEISVSSIKEPNYFTAEKFNRCGPGDKDFLPMVDATNSNIGSYTGVVLAEAVYHSLYSNAAGVWCDASPSYMYYPGVAKALYQYNPSAKVIILLRDPVARMRSAYGMNVQWGREYLTLGDALESSKERMADGWEFYWDYEGASLYANAVAEYISVFGRENVAVMSSSELFNDLRGAMTCLREWFDVDTSCFSAEGPKVNARSYEQGLLMLWLNKSYVRSKYAQECWPKFMWKAFRGLDHYGFSRRNRMYDIPDSVRNRLIADCDLLEGLLGMSYNTKWRELYG